MSLELSARHFAASTKAIHDFSRAFEQLEPQKSEVVAAVSAYVIDIILGEGVQKPTSSDKADYRERRKGIEHNKRNDSLYADCVVVLDIHIKESKARHPADKDPFSSRTKYVMAKSMEVVIDQWRNNGGVKAYEGTNTDDLLAILQSFHGIWNIDSKCESVNLLNEKAKDAAKLKSEANVIVGLVNKVVSSVEPSCPLRDSALDLDKRAQRALRTITSKSSLVDDALEDAIEAEWGKDAKAQLVAATKLLEDIILLRETIDNLNAEAVQLGIEPDDDEGNHPPSEVDGNESRPFDVDADADPLEGEHDPDKVESPFGGILGLPNPAAGNDDQKVGWEVLEAAFSSRMESLTAEDHVMMALEKLRVPPKAGLHTIYATCTGAKVLKVEHAGVE